MTNLNRRSLSWASMGLVGIWVAGALLRALASANDLWLDEIWTLLHLQGATSAWDIFTKIRADNNHLLNSLYLYLVGEGAPQYSLRLLSLVSGIASLLLVLRIGLRRSRLQGLLFLGLVSFSFLMVLYSSEARGYAPMLLGVLVCFDSLERYLESYSSAALVTFWCGSVLGILAHFSFVQLLLAVAVWLVLRSTSAEGMGRRWRCALLVVGPPLAFFGGLYLFHIRHLPPGSGPVYPVLQVLIDALSLAGGGPQLSPTHLDVSTVALVISFLLGLLTLSQLWRSWREGHPLRVFFVTVLVVVPVLFLVVLDPDVIFVRYVLISILFWYLLMAESLERLVKRGSVGKALVLAGITLFMIGNGMHLTDLLRYGRGQYREALSAIAEESEGPIVEVGSDYDFRNQALIEYHWPAVNEDIPVDYVPEAEVPRRLPEWYLAHSQDLHYLPPAEVQLGGGKYDLFREFPSAAQSGWAWFVYKKR